MRFHRVRCPRHPPGSHRSLRTFHGPSPAEDRLPPTTRDWHLSPQDDDGVRRLAAAAQIPPVMAQLLWNRGVRDAASAKQFLHSPMTDLHPPQLLPGVEEASSRIWAAIRARRKIVVYGDYDVDGTTGTAILLILLDKLGADVGYYVPHRIDEGYGLNADAVRKLAADGKQLLITVDCGITSVREAEVAREVGIELIITDHHEMKETLPGADVLVHPRLPGSQYPFAGLSGAGVAFKLAWAVAQRASNSDRVLPELREVLLDLLGLAALGLVADVVPLRDENRVIVKHGLKRLVDRPSIGVRALLTAAGFAGEKPVRAEDVSFRLAPRLNAAGRLGYAGFVVELLTTTKAKKAEEIATYLESQNGERQAIERKIVREAKDLAEAAGYDTAPAIVLGSTEWHPGVVGIVAGRLAEFYARPTLIVALKEEGASSGSGRSVVGFPLHEALMACDDVLLGHGGHAAAAGFRVSAERLGDLRERFCEEVSKVFPGGLPRPRLRLDAEVPLGSLTYGLMRDIDRLEPYGAENPKPKFLASGLKIEGEARKIGVGERHLSFRVRQGQSVVRAVAFGFADRVEDLMSGGGDCCLAFTPKVNEWNGRTSVEIEVIDFRPTALAPLV